MPASDVDAVLDNEAEADSDVVGVVDTLEEEPPPTSTDNLNFMIVAEAAAEQATSGELRLILAL